MQQIFVPWAGHFTEEEKHLANTQMKKCSSYWS